MSAYERIREKQEEAKRKREDFRFVHSRVPSQGTNLFSLPLFLPVSLCLSVFLAFHILLCTHGGSEKSEVDRDTAVLLARITTHNDGCMTKTRARACIRASSTLLLSAEEKRVVDFGCHGEDARLLAIAAKTARVSFARLRARFDRVFDERTNGWIDGQTDKWTRSRGGVGRDKKRHGAEAEQPGERELPGTKASLRGGLDLTSILGRVHSRRRRREESVPSPGARMAATRRGLHRPD